MNKGGACAYRNQVSFGYRLQGKTMEVNEGQGLCKMAGNPVAFFDLAKGWNLFLAVFH